MSVRARRALASLTVLVAGLVGGGIMLGFAPAAVVPAAGAATCTSAGGVSVVVDYRELGGSTVTACAPDGGGKSAAAIFESVGVGLTYATRQPGFVCRVNGVPASDPCVNASPSNAYWGLWWADGSQASWTYSSYGAGGLTVPAGGSVGWSWQQDRPAGGAVPPSVAPPVFDSPSPSPSPTSSPTSSSPTASPSSGGSTSGSGSSGGGSGGGSNGTQSTSPSPSASGSTSPSATPSGSASSTPSASPLAPDSPSDSRSRSGVEERSKDDSVGDESPGDSRRSKDADPSAGTLESPSDSPASAAPEAGQPTADEPARVPAVVTWSIVALLAIAIATSAVVARRRRGSDAP